jgi:predicted P-loop ATPase
MGNQIAQSDYGIQEKLSPMDELTQRFSDNKGRIKIKRSAILLALDPFKVRYDNFTDKIYLTKDGSVVEFNDHICTKLCESLEDLGFDLISLDMMSQCVHSLSKSNQFDSAVDWGESLKWDKVDRSSKFLSVYFGCEDNEYNSAVGLYVLTSMAARMMSPGGVKVDMTMVLYGMQGFRKSSGVEGLAPTKDAFLTFNLGHRDADLSRLMQGKSIGEFGELRGLKTRDSEDIKAWLVQESDSWVRKYLESTTTRARRLIFIGTTNDNEFLTDPTGNRRWLPVHVIRPTDPEAIRRDNQQIWAEAIHLFKAHGVLWEAAERLAKMELPNYLSMDDHLSGIISEIFKDQRKPIKRADLYKAIAESGKYKTVISKFEQTIIKNTLQANGWNVDFSYRFPGEKTPIKCFVPPADKELEEF